MVYKTTYKFRIYPDKTQINKIDNILDLSHRLYNAMLEQRKMAYELNKDFHEYLMVNCFIFPFISLCLNILIVPILERNIWVLSSTLNPDCGYVIDLYCFLDLNLGNPALIFFPAFFSFILLKKLPYALSSLSVTFCFLDKFLCGNRCGSY